MGIGQFFKKLGSDTKKFFSKGGAADVGLRKIGNTLTKAGGVAQAVAPLVSVVAPEVGIPLMAAGVAGARGANSALNSTWMKNSMMGVPPQLLKKLGDDPLLRSGLLAISANP